MGSAGNNFISNRNYLFMLVLLVSIALRFTNEFIGEFLLLNGVYSYNVWTALFAGTTVILGAVYMLRGYKAIMLGDRNVSVEVFVPLSKEEKTVLIIITSVIIITGVCTKPILDIA